jgi:hypothetical protein
LVSKTVKTDNRYLVWMHPQQQLLASKAPSMGTYKCKWRQHHQTLKVRKVNRHRGQESKVPSIWIRIVVEWVYRIAQWRLFTSFSQLKFKKQTVSNLLKLIHLISKPIRSDQP